TVRRICVNRRRNAVQEQSARLQLFHRGLAWIIRITYESKNQPLLPGHRFAHRLAIHVLYVLLVFAATVVIGVAAHIWLEPVNWHDAVLNTSLIVGGIGPYIVPETAIGKLFFAGYSMFVGLVFVATLGIILAPLAHRIIHKFHLDDDDA